MEYIAIDQAASDCGCIIKRDEPMSGYTSFKIGGPADRMAVVEHMEQLRCMLKAARLAETPLFVFGKGSNLLVSDHGFRGVALMLAGEFKRIELLDDRRTVRCGSGTSLAALCRFARDHALSGLEFAWGIPGSVGGAVYMNAGAYGGEMRDIVASAEHITRAGELGKLSQSELQFAYRSSAYQETSHILTHASFALEPGDMTEISARMDELMQKRKDKQPYDMPSGGSTFKRPKGYFAAALIEECGLKGLSVGQAMVSEKHAGFIVNTGGATCKDVVDLIDQVKQEVFAQKQVKLECEVMLVGSER